MTLYHGQRFFVNQTDFVIPIISDITLYFKLLTLKHEGDKFKNIIN